MPRKQRPEASEPDNETRDASPAASPALTAAEWESGIAQRGSLMIVGLREDPLSLIRTASDGESSNLAIDRDQRLTVAAAALAGTTEGFTAQDYDDEIITAVLLAYYQRGVPFAELKQPLRKAFDELIVRRRQLARRIGNLLGPGQRRGA